MTEHIPVPGRAEFLLGLSDRDPECESSSDELNKVLESTVKKDESPKTVTFLGMLLAQTDEDQYNVAFQAESTTGKTYVPLQLVEFFPSREVRIYAGASPTSFFHLLGESTLLVDLEKQVDLHALFDEDELEKERKADTEFKADEKAGKKPKDHRRRVTFIDLERKNLLFEDAPHWMLLERLRPLLSHDRKVLRYDITDKSGKGGNRTKTVVIKGYPTVTFSTTKSTQEDQERTRMWLLSPETSQEKLKESLKLLGFRLGERAAFKTWVEKDPGRQWLKARIASIRATGIRDVIIPDWERVLEEYEKDRKFLSPRAQRDWPRLLYLIKGFALYNCFHRSRTDNSIYANKDDIQAALKLYEELSKSNELGLSPETYRIYEKVIQALYVEDQGIDRKTIQTKYRELYHRPLPDDRLRREILPTLESAGLIGQEPDPLDKRRMLVWCTVPSPISSDAKEANGDTGNRGDISAPQTVTLNGVRLDTTILKDYIYTRAMKIEDLVVGYSTLTKVEYHVVNRFGEEAESLVMPQLTALVQEGKITPGPFTDCWRLVK